MSNLRNLISCNVSITCAVALGSSTEKASDSTPMEVLVPILVAAMVLLVILFLLFLKFYSTNSAKSRNMEEEVAERGRRCGNIFICLLGCCGVGTPLGSMYVQPTHTDMV